MKKYLDSGDKEMISLTVDILFESFDLVHDECFFSRIDSVDGGVQGDKTDTENGCKAAEFVHY